MKQPILWTPPNLETHRPDQSRADPAEQYDFASMLAAFNEIDGWLKANQFTTNHRFRRYAANIRMMLERENDGSMEAFQQAVTKEKAREILWSYVEIDEFVRAITSLREHFGENVPRDVIERALHGPADLFLEDDTNSNGRNFMFELIMGGRFAAANRNPSFEEPDIRLKFAGLNVAVQCKRPLNESSLRKNIGKAIKQLREVQADLKLIAISVSRILLSGDPSRIPYVPRPELGHEYLKTQLCEIAVRSERFWRGKPDCDGVLLYAFLPIRSRRRNGRLFYSPYRHEIVVPTVSGSKNAFILRCFSQSTGE
jgi:hypothetical protein